MGKGSSNKSGLLSFGVFVVSILLIVSIIGAFSSWVVSGSIKDWQLKHGKEQEITGIILTVSDPFKNAVGQEMVILYSAIEHSLTGFLGSASSYNQFMVPAKQVPENLWGKYVNKKIRWKFSLVNLNHCPIAEINLTNFEVL